VTPPLEKNLIKYGVNMIETANPTMAAIKMDFTSSWNLSMR